MPAELNPVQLHSHAGGKDLHYFSLPAVDVLVCRSSITGSIGRSVAGTSAAYILLYSVINRNPNRTVVYVLI